SDPEASPPECRVSIAANGRSASSLTSMGQALQAGPGRGLCPDQRRLPAVRSYRELWLWLGGLFLTLFVFLAAVAIAYFLKQENYSLFLNGWMLGALICFLASYACFFGAIR